jgi:AcrR family transcriptional regulator
VVDKVDRRVQRTQDLLGDALISLILEKGYDRITIQEITGRANVAYSTFFRHYRDKGELLAARLGEAIQDLIGRIDAASAEPTGSTDGKVIFEHVHEHSTLYRVLLRSMETIPVRQRVTDMIAGINLRTCQSLHQPGALVPPPVAANHIASSLLALIEWWLVHEMPYSVEQMAQIYDRLILTATLNSLHPEQGNTLQN